jgi:benzoyl-CoA reductase subunit C
MFSDFIRLPRRLNSQGTRDYLIGELKRFKESLEKFFDVSISNEDLRKSIRIYNENRKYLRKIHSLRSRNGELLGNFDFFSLIKSSMLTSKEEHNQILKGVIDNMESSGSGGNLTQPIRVFLSGKIAEPLDIFQWVDEMGMIVADDDLAIGSRYFSYEVSEEGDGLEALAESYFHRIPNALVEGREGRLTYILRRVRENGLKGVIFIHLKFCEPLIYDYPDLKKALDREGIPSLLIETELHTSASGQIKTRLQAFAEMIGSNE